MVYVNSEAGALAGSLTWGLTGLLDLGEFSTLESGREAGRASAHLPGPTSSWISVAHSAVFTVRKLEHAMSQPSVRIDEASGAVDCLTARDVAVTEKTVSTGRRITVSSRSAWALRGSGQASDKARDPQSKE